MATLQEIQRLAQQRSQATLAGNQAEVSRINTLLDTARAEFDAQQQSTQDAIDRVQAEDQRQRAEADAEEAAETAAGERAAFGQPPGPPPTPDLDVLIPRDEPARVSFDQTDPIASQVEGVVSAGAISEALRATIEDRAASIAQELGQAEQAAQDIRDRMEAAPDPRFKTTAANTLAFAERKAEAIREDLARLQNFLNVGGFIPDTRTLAILAQIRELEAEIAKKKASLVGVPESSALEFQQQALFVLRDDLSARREQLVVAMERAEVDPIIPRTSPGLRRSISDDVRLFVSQPGEDIIATIGVELAFLAGTSLAGSLALRALARGAKAGVQGVRTVGSQLRAAELEHRAAEATVRTHLQDRAAVREFFRKQGNFARQIESLTGAQEIPPVAGASDTLTMTPIRTISVFPPDLAAVEALPFVEQSALARSLLNLPVGSAAWAARYQAAGVRRLPTVIEPVIPPEITPRPQPVPQVPPFRPEPIGVPMPEAPFRPAPEIVPPPGGFPDEEDPFGLEPIAPPEPTPQEPVLVPGFPAPPEPPEDIPGEVPGEEEFVVPDEGGSPFDIPDDVPEPADVLADEPATIPTPPPAPGEPEPDAPPTIIDEIFDEPGPEIEDIPVPGDDDEPTSMADALFDDAAQDDAFEDMFTRFVPGAAEPPPRAPRKLTRVLPKPIPKISAKKPAKEAMRPQDWIQGRKQGFMYVYINRNTGRRVFSTTRLFGKVPFITGKGSPAKSTTNITRKNKRPTVKKTRMGIVNVHHNGRVRFSKAKRK